MLLKPRTTNPATTAATIRRRHRLPMRHATTATTASTTHEHPPPPPSPRPPNPAPPAHPTNRAFPSINQYLAFSPAGSLLLTQSPFPGVVFPRLVWCPSPCVQIDDGEARMTAYLQDADNLAAAKKMLTVLDLISTGSEGQAQTVGVNERATKTGECSGAQVLR